MRRVRYLRTLSTPLRHRPSRASNVALIPGHLLSQKHRWQRIADELPQGAILICLPACRGPSYQVLETVAGLLRSRGHRVAISRADDFCPRTSRTTRGSSLVLRLRKLE